MRFDTYEGVLVCYTEVYLSTVQQMARTRIIDRCDLREKTQHQFPISDACVWVLWLVSKRERMRILQYLFGRSVHCTVLGVQRVVLSIGSGVN